ncbi:MAG: hypothetical protein JNL98_39230 [Bryobacterales bacterium]|nr:hypothetical protein [Bryobacterales bacterium]
MSRPGAEEQDNLLWSAAESRYAIEISRAVLEELNGRVLEGFRRLSRGGVEMGGILFGRRSDTRIRIHSWREVACEHSRGPGFNLSNNDRQKLVQQLETAERDPQLQVLEPLGFFVSHTKAAVSLTDEDLEIYNRFFPEPWQTVLVLYPIKGGNTQAGFFVREQDGIVRRERSYREFVIEGAREPAAAEDRESESAQELVHEDADPVASSSGRRAPASRGLTAKLPIAAAALVVILFALIGVPKLTRGPAETRGQDGVDLKLLADRGQLRIEWNTQSSVIRAADQAELEIMDSGRVPPVKLDAETMRRGKAVYARLSPDVTVRLTLKQGGAVIGRELARSLGAPPEKLETSELREVRERRAKLESEAMRLREATNQEIRRALELEEDLRRLETAATKRKRGS